MNNKYKVTLHIKIIYYTEDFNYAKNSVFLCIGYFTISKKGVQKHGLKTDKSKACATPYFSKFGI